MHDDRDSGGSASAAAAAPGASKERARPTTDSPGGAMSFETLRTSEQQTLAARFVAAVGRKRSLFKAIEGAPAEVTEHELVGLALSGGGIRSATFSLGVLQALGAAEKLTSFDYLSTVSGGGCCAATATISRRAPDCSPPMR
jgi:predicted acylesterase/phospholipase RssA